MSDIGKIGMFAEVDGKLCAVVLPQATMRILWDLIPRLTTNGKVNVAELPTNYKLEPLMDLLG